MSRSASQTSSAVKLRQGRSSEWRRVGQWARMAAAGLAAAGAVLLWAALARHFAPLSNTQSSQFDAIVILGTPADRDGNPTPSMLDRVTEGVREYRRGVAPRLVVTGAAAHNRFVEAETMARAAEAMGVPASSILVEPQALDTIQNACYTARIVKSHGWQSVEVVTSAEHLPRAAMIFAQVDGGRLKWRMHTAPGSLAAGFSSDGVAGAEILKTARYLLWARWTEACSV